MWVTRGQRETLPLTCRLTEGAGEGCKRREGEGGRQTLPSLWSLETLELLWELHFRLTIRISHLQTTLLSVPSFQQLSNPAGIIAYMPLALTLLLTMRVHQGNLIFELCALYSKGRTCLPERSFKSHNTEMTMLIEEKGKRGQCTSVYTWKHRQPSSVIGDPNRITRQARILPSIFKCNIGQVENFYLLICGVNTRGLGRGRRGGGGKEDREGPR